MCKKSKLKENELHHAGTIDGAPSSAGVSEGTFKSRMKKIYDAVGGTAW